MKDRKSLIYACVVVFLVLMFAGYLSYRSRSVVAVEQEALYNVRTTTVAKGFQVWVGGPAYVSDDDVMEITPQISGRIKYIAPQGQLLEEGDLILELISGDGRDVKTAKLNYQYKQDELEGQEEASRVVGEDIDKVSSVRRAKIEAAKAYAEYESYESSLRVVADSPGYIAIPRSSASCSVGSFISQGTKIRFVRIPQGRVFVDVILAQAEVAQVEYDQPAIFSVDTSSGKLTFDGRVIGIDRVSEGMTYGIKVRLLIEGLNEKELKYCIPGSSGYASVMVQDIPCLFVEEAAVAENDAFHFGADAVTKITPINGDIGLATAIPVKASYCYGYALIEIDSRVPLKPGDIVSLDHVINIPQDGARVRISNASNSHDGYAMKTIRKVHLGNDIEINVEDTGQTKVEDAYNDDTSTEAGMSESEFSDDDSDENDDRDDDIADSSLNPAESATVGSENTELNKEAA